MKRCRNCGDREHETRRCTGFGPMYPEPGRSVADYATEQQRIQDLVAGDIVAQHSTHHKEAAPTA